MRASGGGKIPPEGGTAYLCGHNHAGAEVIVKGVPFLTFKSILRQPQVTAYAVVRLFKDRLVIEGRGGFPFCARIERASDDSALPAAPFTARPATNWRGF